MKIKDMEIKQGEPFQVISQTGIGVIDVSSGTRSPVEYIKKYLIKETGQIMRYHQELSWVLMVAGIELLGRCVSLDQNSIADTDPRNNRPYFRAGLKLFPDKYQVYNTDLSVNDLWKFRCNLSHATFAIGNFVISETINNAIHLSILDNKLVLVAEDFYEDFKIACEKAIGSAQTNSKFHIKTVRHT